MAREGRGIKLKSDGKGPGNLKKSDVPGGARGGMGSEQFDQRIRHKTLTYPSQTLTGPTDNY